MEKSLRDDKSNSFLKLAIDLCKIRSMPQVNPAKFFVEVKSELLKVTWPTKNQVVRLTTVVVVISLVVGLFIGGLDFSLTKIVELIVKK